MQHRMTLFVVLLMSLVLPPNPGAQHKPAGELVYALHVSLSPSWFDPLDTPAQITPYGILYALHDAVVRPLPGERMGAALAESWQESPDGLTYTFILRPNLTFHNGDPCTAEDVVFSYTRYKGTGAGEFKAKVKQVEAVDARTVRFHLHAPWPDFMAFYGTTATAAGIVMPKKYLEQVGEDGFKKHPIGMGPYKFVSHTPGVELVLEAHTGYWRHAPYIQRMVMKGVSEGTTRLAMLKRGEADIAFALEGEVAAEVQRDPKLTLVDTRHASIQWIDFAEQWDPKSPWHDLRVRQAANYALDRQAINDAACLGFCPPTAVFIPRVMDFALQTEPLPYDPKKAKQLLAEAGYPNGFDAGELAPVPPFYVIGEAVVNYLNAVGIRVKMRTMERAAFYAAWKEKKLPGLAIVGSGTSGNAASRLETFTYSKGAYAYGGYPDIDALYQQQAVERDRTKREALLHRIQQLTMERAMYAPIMDFRALVGVGPRVAEHAIHALPVHPFPALEEIRLK
ncbi:MAG: ABC transporter substrate-binding protein [Candidatus Tectomicrobia bacterium]|uniref:ABC transporter substrate-binding protein n=1 Tax=Tectimicrobiota bacterium TaxID=2528274 RepID=A0A938B517_UNCTE|nr:ABC transporter substrate-binding protein [Candidatus Tectomicrobia bacterium]